MTVSFELCRKGVTVKENGAPAVTLTDAVRTTPEADGEEEAAVPITEEGATPDTLLPGTDGSETGETTLEELTGPEPDAD